MIRSMTGYARAQAEGAGFTLAISLKAVNHRFLDLQFRLPSDLAPFEPGLRRVLKEQIARGHIEVNVNLERADGALKLDRHLLEAYVKAWQQLRNELGSGADPDLMALLRIPGIVTSGGSLSQEEMSLIQKSLESALVQAVRELNEMRSREGESIEKDVRERVARIEELRQKVASLVAQVPTHARQRLERRLAELLGAEPVDPARLAQEVAFLVSRIDVSEELTRIESHLAQARELLQAKSEAGKKLDFLLQELNREANTLLSKMADVPEIGVEVGRHTIEIKSEIEKLREQAQNIE